MEQDNNLSDAEKGQVRVQLIGVSTLFSLMTHQAGLLNAASAHSPRLDQETHTDLTVLDSLPQPCLDLAEISL
jgi:hypothetical protein